MTQQDQLIKTYSITKLKLATDLLPFYQNSNRKWFENEKSNFKNESNT